MNRKGKTATSARPIRQSDGSYLTPFQQAKRYSANLPYSLRPRWIVTCNFKEFLVYDMENPNGEPEEILLVNLPEQTYRLEFLVDAQNQDVIREMEISIKAGEIVGKLYDALLAQYRDPTNPDSLKSLNMLCVRLVFCLYAEDAGIFGKHGIFKDYLKRHPNPADVRKSLIELFAVLNQTTAERDQYMEPALAAFPYVNGGLFEAAQIEIPGFSPEIVNLLIHDASEDFDWQAISPTIFGAVFESTLNPATRRSGGMHYTSIENIHKVIDPLFLDNLQEEFDRLKSEPVEKTRNRNLSAFQDKLAGLTFLDPACGSGNFLTESYLALRRLENELLKVLLGEQIRFGSDLDTPIKVSIHQFYGIEINDFAVAVGKTALWIAEAQMMRRTEDIIHSHLDFLPLKSYANIIEGNALRLDWEGVVPKAELDFVMGNPPFVGYSLQSKEQKNDLLAVYVDETGKPYKSAGKIDFVAGWYFKAAQLMAGTGIRTAFVSTNSITQGEQVAGVFKPLYQRFGIDLDFAYRTFKWASEASDQAAVHCVIIGFSHAESPGEKRIYSGEAISSTVALINPYLVEAPVVFIEAARKPICPAPAMSSGSKPAENGNLIFTKAEVEAFLKGRTPGRKMDSALYDGQGFSRPQTPLLPVAGGQNPAELKHCKGVMERVRKVKEFRENSTKAATRKKAETPTLFDENKQPDTNFVAIPSVSSERRRYIPMDFMSPETIVGNNLFFVENVELYHFAVLTSNVHMAWMRATAGRLEMRYRYSNIIVYNNFVWPTPTDKQKALIEKTAQAILSARQIYPDCSLADLYDEITMPKELRRAHQANDKAVLAAYGFASNILESQCVAELMRRYQDLCGE